MSIRAWRFWRVMEYQGEPWLWSVYMNVRWPGPVLLADERPTWNGPHGIHAYRTPHAECQVTRGAVERAVRELGMVAGWVELYGHIVEHTDGYRAEAALVAAFLVSDPAWYPFLPGLERRYEADVQTDGFIAVG